MRKYDTSNRHSLMQEADKIIANTSKDLAQSRTDCAEKEASIASLKIEMQKLNKALEEKQSNVQATEEEVRLVLFYS